MAASTTIPAALDVTQRHLSKTSQQSLRPTHFLARPTGELVPVIALDELPPGTNIVGIPRTMGNEAVFGMISMGIVKKNRAGYYALKEDHPNAKGLENSIWNEQRRLQEQDLAEQMARINKKLPANVNGLNIVHKTGKGENAQVRRLPVAPLNSPETSPSSTGYHTCASSDSSQSSNNLKQSQETDLCRHWCQFGNCKWGLECHYKHIMPMTMSGLAEAGLRDWPAWYRALNPGYFVDSVAGVPDNYTRHPRQRRAAENRKVMYAKRSAVDHDLASEIIQRLRVMDMRSKEKRRRDAPTLKQNVPTALQAEEMNRRIAEESKTRKEASARGMVVQQSVERSAKRWADEDSEDSGEETPIRLSEEKRSTEKVTTNLVEI